MESFLAFECKKLKEIAQNSRPQGIFGTWDGCEKLRKN